MSVVRADDLRRGMIILAESGLSTVEKVQALGNELRILWVDGMWSQVPRSDLLHLEEVDSQVAAASPSERMVELLGQYFVSVKGDRPWQARMRLLQALWAVDQGVYGPGTYTSYPKGSDPVAVRLGTRLPEPVQDRDNRNFLEDRIGDVVRATIEDKSQHRVIVQPRIWLDLLSSQPLCFNLFARLKLDPDLATRVLRRLWPEFVGDCSVVDVEFEWSPGRDDPRFLGNRSAFDVIFFLADGQEAVRFIGIETKYHETLVGGAKLKTRYEEVARRSGLFTLGKPKPQPAVERGALQQIWLDHLLALSMVQSGQWQQGMFVLAYPERNDACRKGARAYRQELSPTSTFDTVTLERIVQALRSETGAQWVQRFYDRYLDETKIDRLLQPVETDIELGSASWGQI